MVNRSERLTLKILSILSLSDRSYEHSIQCVEKSLPNCRAGDVQQLISFYLEFANLTNTVYDNKCEGMYKRFLNRCIIICY